MSIFEEYGAFMSFFFFFIVFVLFFQPKDSDAITKTCLYKYIENFTSKNGKFSDKNSDSFSYFCSKHRLWVLVRTASPRRF